MVKKRNPLIKIPAIILLSFIGSTILYIVLKYLYENLEIFFGNSIDIILIYIVILVYFIYSFFNKNKILSFFIFSIIIYSIYLFFEFEKNFIFFNIDFKLLILSILMMFHFIILFVYFRLELDELEKYFSYLTGISIIFLIGFTFILGITQEEKHSFEFRLNNCIDIKNYESSTISCENKLGKFIVGTKVFCNINNIDFKLNNASFNFFYLNGSIKHSNFNDSINFIVDKEIARVDLKIYGVHENKSICLSSGVTQTYATYDQYKNNRENFLLYLLSFFGLLLLVFPEIYLKWKTLFKKLK